MRSLRQRQLCRFMKSSTLPINPKRNQIAERPPLKIDRLRSFPAKRFSFSSAAPKLMEREKNRPTALTGNGISELCCKASESFRIAQSLPWQIQNFFSMQRVNLKKIPSMVRQSACTDSSFAATCFHSSILSGKRSPILVENRVGISLAVRVIRHRQAQYTNASCVTARRPLPSSGTRRCVSLCA